jgi:NAD(P)H-quinone oxidoreductase subunit 4
MNKRKIYIFAPWLVVIGAIQIVYAAFTSFSQRNLKRRIAYSSVSHMGFVLIGIGSITDIGLNGKCEIDVLQT